MTATYTPGPWPHKPRARDGHVDKIEYKGKTLASVGAPWAEEPILDYPHENEQTANARLIAAAPDLLRSLKRAEEVIRSMCMAVDPDRAAGAAAEADVIADMIKAATGEN